MHEVAPALVLDASVAINLNATGRATEIAAALPFRLQMADIAQSELGVDRRSGRDDGALIVELARRGLLAVVPLSEAALEVFATLVAGRAEDTLDDGEAATLALAAEQSAMAAIDERKARRIAQQRFGAVALLSSVALCLHPDVMKALGRSAVTDAVFQALQTARMRVLPDDVERVVSLIGTRRARECPSLPAWARRG